MTVSTGQIRERLSYINERRRFYEHKATQPNRLALHEVWRHIYLSHPYLLGAPNNRVAERFRNIFMNVMEIGQNGKLCPVPLSENDEYMQVFTHIKEEYGVRHNGLPPEDIIESARQPILKYFEHGEPIGYKMFSGYHVPETPIIVKYGKRQFLEAMFENGSIRLASASSYNNPNLLSSVRDDETSRTFFIPTYKERLEGKTSINFQGHELEFGDDDLALPVVVDDYYLLSLCEKIHHRMPNDFNADAALVIRNPVLFKQLVISKFLADYPNWVHMEGKVSYYDPYRDYTKFKNPEMAKHFGYGYQNEIRVAFRSRQKIITNLEPVFLSIGSMRDYADLVSV